MNNLVQSLLNEINLVRTKPAEYANKLLAYKEFFNDKTLSLPGEKPLVTKEGFGAFYEAAHHLNQITPVQRLTLDSGLTEVAEDALFDIYNVETAHSLHQYNFDMNLERFGFVIGSYNEALELGSVNPEAIVAHLLVDDGDLDRGNRKHILHPGYNIMGCASAPHKFFNHATIITYAKSYYKHGEQALAEEHKEETKVDKKQETQISKKPKVTHHETEDHEIITDKGKIKEHIIVDEKEVKKDGYLSYSYYKSTSSTQKPLEETEKLPEDVVKIDRDEKIVIENGKKKKIITTKKTMKDGSVKTEESVKDLDRK